VLGFNLRGRHQHRVVTGSQDQDRGCGWTGARKSDRGTRSNLVVGGRLKGPTWRQPRVYSIPQGTLRNASNRPRFTKHSRGRGEDRGHPAPLDGARNWGVIGHEWPTSSIRAHSHQLDWPRPWRRRSLMLFAIRMFFREQVRNDEGGEGSNPLALLGDDSISPRGRGGVDSVPPFPARRELDADARRGAAIAGSPLGGLVSALRKLGVGR